MVFSQFLLRQAFADDEASTRLIQILLFLLLSTASLMLSAILFVSTRITSHSQTLIDYIFSSAWSKLVRAAIILFPIYQTIYLLLRCLLRKRTVREPTITPHLPGKLTRKMLSNLML